MINLGGSPAPDWLGRTVRGCRAAILQTNADENSASDATRKLDELSDLGVANVVVVTAGRAARVLPA